MDVAGLQASFRHVEAAGDDAVLYFYEDLHVKHPATRKMFPVATSEQRRHFLAALKHIVAGVADPPALAGYLRELGVRHRKFGTLAAHYEPVGQSFLATLEHFCADVWTPELRNDWADAYGFIARVMQEAAAADEAVNPPSWAGIVTARTWHPPGVAVLSVRTEPRLHYLPGQAAEISIGSRAKLWRWYCIACPPRDDGTLEFHIRNKGPVSQALMIAEPGTRLLLGPPGGNLAYRDTGRDILICAQSTGIAPALAIIGHLAARPGPRVHLLYGGGRSDDLYMWPGLEKMRAALPWLNLTPVVPGNGPGTLAAAILASGPWDDRDAYAAGPSEAIAGVTAALAGTGMPGNQVAAEDFGWNEMTAPEVPLPD